MVYPIVSLTLLLTTLVAGEPLKRLENFQDLVHKGLGGRKRETNANDILKAFQQLLDDTLKKNNGESNVLNNVTPPAKYSNINGLIQNNQINRFRGSYPLKNKYENFIVDLQNVNYDSHSLNLPKLNENNNIGFKYDNKYLYRNPNSLGNRNTFYNAREQSQFNNLKPQNYFGYSNTYLTANDDNMYKGQVNNNPPYPFITNYGYYQLNNGAPNIFYNQLPYGNRYPVYSENYYQAPLVKTNGFLSNYDQTRDAGVSEYGHRIPLVDMKDVLNNKDQTKNPNVNENIPSIPFFNNKGVWNNNYQTRNHVVNGYGKRISPEGHNDVVIKDKQIKNPVFSELSNQNPLTENDRFFKSGNQTKNVGVSRSDPRTPSVETNDVLNNNDRSTNPDEGGKDPRIPLVEPNRTFTYNFHTRNPNFSRNDTSTSLSKNNNDQNRNPGVSGFDPTISLAYSNDVLNTDDQTINHGGSGYDSKIPTVDINHSLVNNDETSNPDVSGYHPSVPLIVIKNVFKNDDKNSNFFSNKYDPQIPVLKNTIVGDLGIKTSFRFDPPKIPTFNLDFLKKYH